MAKPQKAIGMPAPRGNRHQRRAMEKTAKINREFSYSLPGVNLNFTLRIDNDSELRPFKQCLEEAIKDIDAELAKLK